MLRLHRLRLISLGEREPCIVELGFEFFVLVEPQDGVGGHASAVDRGLGVGARAVGPRGRGGREVEEGAPGTGVAPSVVIGLVDGTEIGFEPLATGLGQRGGGGCACEPGFAWQWGGRWGR